VTIRTANTVRRWLCVPILVVVAVLGAAPRGSAQTLTNADVIKMVQARLGDTVIISEIKHSTCKFDISPDALIKLKQSGVSDKVLEAMTEAAHSISGGRTASPTSNGSAPTPLPENYGIYALDRGKLYDFFGANPSEGAPIRVIGVYSFETNGGKAYPAAIIGPGVAFIIFDQASGDLSRGLSLYRLPFGRYLKVGGSPKPINGPLAARFQAFRIPLLSKPVPGQSQMVETSPNSPLTPGDYLLFLARGQQYQAQLIVVGPPPTLRAQERGSCVDISFPGGFGGIMEMGDYWAMHGPPEFPEITPDHYSVCSGGPGTARGSNGAPLQPGAHIRGAGPAGSLPCNNYQACMQAGVSAFNHSDLSAAVHDFQGAANQQPRSANPWVWLGRTYMRSKETDNSVQAWDKALNLGGSIGFRVWHDLSFGVEVGIFSLSSSRISFVNRKGKTAFAVLPAQVKVVGAYTIQNQSYFRLRVAGRNYNFDFVPFGEACQVSIVVECPPQGLGQEQSVANYVTQTIPKLASGALAPTPPPAQPKSAPAPNPPAPPAASTGTASCAQAVSAGYAILAGGQLYTVKKFNSATAGQIPVFSDTKGLPVASGPLLHRLEAGAWTHDNIVASAATRAEITTKLRALPDVISTSQALQAYEAIQDVLARGMAEAIEAAVTGGVSLSKAVPNLEWGIVESQLSNSPRTVLALSAQVGLQYSLGYYKQLSDPKTLPPADSTALDITTLENVKAVYSQAQALDFPNEALAAALMPTSAAQLTNEALNSVVSELLPGLPSPNEAVTLEGLLNLQKSLAQVGQTVPALQKYAQNFGLELHLWAAYDSKINTWTAEATTACGNTTAGPAAAPMPAAGIRDVDFFDFTYPSACWRNWRNSGFTRIIQVSGGKWMKGTGSSQIYFDVDKPMYADLRGDGGEEAVVVTDCGFTVSNTSSTEVFVFGMAFGRPRLLTRLEPSEWDMPSWGFDWGGARVRIENRDITVTFSAGGYHARPAWIATAFFQWNGTRFVRTRISRKPFPS
jgi:hypothetical protein